MILSVLAGCGQKQEAPSMSSEQTRIPVASTLEDRFRYLDPEIPLTIVASSAAAQWMKPQYHSYGYEVYASVGFFSFFQVAEDYREGPGEIGHARMEIRLRPLSSVANKLASYGANRDGIPGNSDYTPGRRYNEKTTACYNDVPYVSEQEGIKEITQTLLIKQPDGSYAKETVPAQMQVYMRSSCFEDNFDENVDQGYNCSQEVHWIIPQLPPGLLPEGQGVLIETSYTVSNSKEPEAVRQAKKKADEQICDTLKNISWVKDPSLGLPPKWENIRWPDDYPLTKIVIKGQRNPGADSGKNVTVVPPSKP